MLTLQKANENDQYLKIEYSNSHPNTKIILSDIVKGKEIDLTKNTTNIKSDTFKNGKHNIIVNMGNINAIAFTLFNNDKNGEFSYMIKYDSTNDLNEHFMIKSDSVISKSDTNKLSIQFESIKDSSGAIHSNSIYYIKIYKNSTIKTSNDYDNLQIDETPANSFLVSGTNNNTCSIEINENYTNVYVVVQGKALQGETFELLGYKPIYIPEKSPTSPDKSWMIYVIIGSAILCIALLVGLFFLYRKCRQMRSNDVTKEYKEIQLLDNEELVY